MDAKSILIACFSGSIGEERERKRDGFCITVIARKLLSIPSFFEREREKNIVERRNESIGNLGMQSGCMSMIVSVDTSDFGSRR